MAMMRRGVADAGGRPEDFWTLLCLIAWRQWVVSCLDESRSLMLVAAPYCSILIFAFQLIPCSISSQSPPTQLSPHAASPVSPPTSPTLPAHLTDDSHITLPPNPSLYSHVLQAHTPSSSPPILPRDFDSCPSPTQLALSSSIPVGMAADTDTALQKRSHRWLPPLLLRYVMLSRRLEARSPRCTRSRGIGRLCWRDRVA